MMSLVGRGDDPRGSASMALQGEAISGNWADWHWKLCPERGRAVGVWSARHVDHGGKDIA